MSEKVTTRSTQEKTAEYTAIYQQIFDAIDRSQHVMLVMHQKPDGDTAGSCLALSHYLDVIEKPHTCFCVDELSQSLQFLPGKEKVSTDPAHWAPQQTKFDLVIVFDSGDLKYAGVAEYVDALANNVTIINIDHHATNTQYGDHNLVITTASSTCEIVHDLLYSIDSINKHIANCLLTGLITDTGGFTNLATTGSSIHTASQLLLKGANLRAITHNTMHNRSVPTLRLWGRALERLTTSPAGIVSTVITRKDLEECEADDAAIEGVSNFLNSLDQDNGAHATLLLTERPDGTVKGSLRSTHPLIDVSKIATLLGGGGHKKAAGFSVNGRLVEQNGRWSISHN